MKSSEFLKTFKGNLVSVRDDRMSYCCSQESEIADREVEEINSDENGVYVKLKTEIDCAVIKIVNMDNVLRLVLKRYLQK